MRILAFILLIVITKQFTTAVGNNKRWRIYPTFAARKQFSALHVGAVEDVQ
jgi:hypothetical protein